MLDHGECWHLSKCCQLVHEWVQEYWFHRHDDLIFLAPSAEVYFLNSAWFILNLSVPNACSWMVPMVGDCCTGLCSGINVKPVCAVDYVIIIIHARCPCQSSPRFDDTDAAFLMTNWYKLISPFLFGFSSIFGRLGVRKSLRTPLTLLVSTSIIYRTLGGIKGGFVPWDNSYNLFKR